MQRERENEYLTERQERQEYWGPVPPDDVEVEAGAEEMEVETVAVTVDNCQDYGVGPSLLVLYCTVAYCADPLESQEAWNALDEMFRTSGYKIMSIEPLSDDLEDWRVEVTTAAAAPVIDLSGTLVWDAYEGGATYRVRLVSNGVAAYSGVGASREEALADLLGVLKCEATFDHPENPLARWGRVYRVEGARVWLEAVGWGFVWEIKGVRK